MLPSDTALRKDIVQLLILRYGIATIINPLESLIYKHFKVVVTKEISLIETFKILIAHQPFTPQKPELFSVQQISSRCKRRIPSQVAGEYCGNEKNILAKGREDAIAVIVPEK